MFFQTTLILKSWLKLNKNLFIHQTHFVNQFRLIGECSTNKLKQSITPHWQFFKWKFENKTSIDGKNSFIYSISQNPYFLKSIINFEIEEIDGINSMFSSLISSNKSKSLIYRLMLARLRELAKPKTLNHKYDDKRSTFQIDIGENYFFWWMIIKDKDMAFNLDLCKFILAKIWSNLYHYLILHRWYIPFKIESRVKSMIKYMKNYKHSKKIKFKNVVFYHKLRSKNFIDTVFNLIAWSSFPEIWLLISYRDISNCIKATFSNIMKLYSPSVQKVVIFNHNAFDFKDWENPSKDKIKVILREYGVNYHTYILYKFLENSRLLDSIKEIEFIDSVGIDYTILESLIVKYQSKHSIQWGISFLLRTYSNNITDSTIKVNLYFYSLVSYLI